MYASELKGKKRSDNVEGRDNAWLKRQPLHIRQAILGVKGEQEWKAGRAGWMEKTRNLNISTVGYYGLKSRLRKFVNGIFGKESTTITYEVLPKIDGNPGIEENTKNTNPNFYSKKKGSEYYRDNCQKCVPAFELRMRGMMFRQNGMIMITGTAMKTGWNTIRLVHLLMQKSKRFH